MLTIQGNYDEWLALGKLDFGCGCTDPRDNHFARISYEYTFAKTSMDNKRWLGGLPTHRRPQLGTRRVLMSHGSPRVINEFLWESATPTGLLKRFLREGEADILLCTHTGIKWHRALPDGTPCRQRRRHRPPGKRRLEQRVIHGADRGPGPSVEFIPVHYDYETLARQMEPEWPWWTTCLENLPSKERSRGKF